MAYTPLAGSAGRLRLGSATSGVSGVTSWELAQKSEIFPGTHFESGAEATGVIAEDRVASNIAGYTIRFTAWFDADTVTTFSNFPIGTGVVMDLLYNKATTFGFHNKTVYVSNVTAGPKLREQQAYNFDGEMTGTLGVPAAS